MAAPDYTPSRMIAASKRAVRAQGCACKVQATIVRRADGMFHVTLSHDDWCPLLRTIQERSPGPARTQLVFVMPGFSENDNHAAQCTG